MAEKTPEVTVVDAHCHLDSFKKKQLEALPRGIIPVTCGYSHSSNKKTVEIAREMGVPFCLGIAPQTVLKEGKGELGKWMQFIADSKPNAVGEVGLDRYWGKTREDFELEEEVFREMIMLAQKLELPLAIHSRKAEEWCLDVLEDAGWRGKFMMHFFAGNLEGARRAVDMGGIISIIGLHSKYRKKIIREIPLEKMVVETDAPYVTRNIDGVFKAIEYISGITGLPEKEVGEITAKNASEFFGFEI
ncbi:MAG: TatD family hydrolase [Candidatus Micrarchaeia archaeon]